MVEYLVTLHNGDEEALDINFREQPHFIIIRY